MAIVPYNRHSGGVSQQRSAGRGGAGGTRANRGTEARGERGKRRSFADTRPEATIARETTEKGNRPAIINQHHTMERRTSRFVPKKPQIKLGKRGHQGAGGDPLSSSSSPSSGREGSGTAAAGPNPPGAVPSPSSGRFARKS
ncbi:hypothetical protein THAOC_01532, partial [Thalassiosira oceanica]